MMTTLSPSPTGTRAHGAPPAASPQAIHFLLLPEFSVMGFVSAIERCGAILAEHFPPGALKRDELPDRLHSPARLAFGGRWD